MYLYVISDMVQDPKYISKYIILKYISYISTVF